MPETSPSLLARVRSLSGTLLHEAGKFGTIGLLCFVIDTALYNLLVFGLPGSDGGPMSDIPLRGKIVATSVAIVVGWIGNRHWTWRHRRGRAAHREFFLFVLFAGIGMVIALVCLGFSRYVLDLHSQLADNIAGNGVGLVLGTLFRFWAYRTFVFPGTQDEATAQDSDDGGTGSEGTQDTPGTQGSGGTPRRQRTGAIDT